QQTVMLFNLLVGPAELGGDMSRVYPWDRPFGSGNERSPAVDAHLILWVVFGLPAQSAVLCCRLRSSTLELCPISIRRGSSRSVLVSSASSPVHTLQSNWAIWHCEKINAWGRKAERLKTSVRYGVSPVASRSSERHHNVERPR